MSSYTYIHLHAQVQRETRDGTKKKRGNVIKCGITFHLFGVASVELLRD